MPTHGNRRSRVTGLLGSSRCDLAAHHLHPDGRTMPITVRMLWQPRDSAVVTTWFPELVQGPVWFLSVELLAAGCDAPAGLGDVSLIPHPHNPQRAELILVGDSGRACLSLPLPPLRRFLARVPGEHAPEARR
ncbi:SsgA family sporulation/cell division regulator [Pseudonocardia sp. EV170527-09]|uniref:SsgA family sporulation/cell division regulator n=1 Tax=Pseudonocardia sp. EV170527-09 TaxID=2603411 RepID=UPI001386CC5D|nr:SsgA family sporulation/cell division regulator [Pseudonocardia sp. EV170527-09]